MRAIKRFACALAAGIVLTCSCGHSLEQLFGGTLNPADLKLPSFLKDPPPCSDLGDIAD